MRAASEEVYKKWLGWVQSRLRYLILNLENEPAVRCACPYPKLLSAALAASKFDQPAAAARQLAEDAASGSLTANPQSDDSDPEPYLNVTASCLFVGLDFRPGAPRVARLSLSPSLDPMGVQSLWRSLKTRPSLSDARSDTDSPVLVSPSGPAIFPRH